MTYVALQCYIEDLAFSSPSVDCLHRSSFIRPNHAWLDNLHKSLGIVTGNLGAPNGGMVVVMDPVLVKSFHCVPSSMESLSALKTLQGVLVETVQ